jgi:hypothetical protein
MTITLICLLVGVGDVIGVKVDASEPVIGLKNLIKAAAPDVVRCEARHLELFLAKRGGLWLKSGSEDVKAMYNGEIPDTIKELMRDHMRMDDTYLLVDDEYFGTNFQPGGREIHVLVELPSATQRFNTFRSRAARTESRLKRWRDLNVIYDKSKKARTNDNWEDSDSELSDASEDATSIAPSSSVRWRDVRDVFYPLDEHFTQTRKPFPDDVVDALATYLATVSKTTKGYFDMSVGVQRQLIGPALVTICNLFDDVKLDFDRTVTGNHVHAQIQLDFVLTRGNKTRLCVAHAQRGDFEQARTHVLVACELIAEREDQHVVYGLVTDFLSWHLFRSGEDSIGIDGRMMSILSGELGKASLRDVCEMIFGALVSHDEEENNDHQVAMDESN